MSAASHHRVIIIGGGSAGISVAARLVKSIGDVAVVEPSDKHYYQPLWTLVGAGCAKREHTERSELAVMPKGVTWIKDAVSVIEPENNRITTAVGKTYGYDVLVVCPGIQLDWDKIEGLSQTLGRDGVSSNYTYDLAPKTWDLIRNTRAGRAVFTMPSGAIKCGGAPQKIAYLAADYWREQGCLSKIDVHLVLPTPTMFGVKVFSDALDKVVADYGIKVHFTSELAAVDSASQTASFVPVGESGSGFDLKYDMMHVVPPQSAPDWIKRSPLATTAPTGYVEVDKHTLQHVRYPNIFSLGDAGSTPNSKTGAAIRKQAPVVAANVRSQLAGNNPSEKYGGYGSCPLTTSRSKMLLAEFDYSGQPTPSIPWIDLTKPRRDMWYLKKYGLPFLYWNLMLKGRA